MRTHQRLAGVRARRSRSALVGLGLALAALGLTAHTVAAATASLVMDAPNNPAVLGQSPLPFDVTIAPADSNGPVPTGTVTVYWEGSPVEQGTLAFTGFRNQAIATVDISGDVGLGDNHMTAFYSGDSTYPSMASPDPPVDQVVNKDSTTTTLSASPNPSVVGQPVTFTATSRPASPGTFMPTGVTDFNLEGVFWGNAAVDAQGRATFTASNLSVGKHNVSAHYNGDTQCLPSASTVIVQAVDQVPTVTAVSPRAGPTAGGTAITVTGTNFSAPVTVRVGGVVASNVKVVSATQVTAKTPAHAGGTVDVQVDTGAASAVSSADRFAYGPPVVTSLSPHAGPPAGGTVVTVTGSGFVSGETVSFGTAPATAVTVLTPTQLRATSPAAPDGTVVAVTVTSPAGTSATSASAAFAYHPTPVVSAVSPRAGPAAGGTTITITGTNFGPSATVQVGGTAATNVVVVSATQLTARTPAHAGGTVDAQVTTNGGPSAATAADRFAFGPPVVTSVSPRSGSTAGGTMVTVTGTAFVAGESVRFGTLASPSVTVLSPTTLRATSPAAAASTVDITVTSAAGTSAAGAADRYGYQLPPTVTAVTPRAGSTAGGTTLTITGTNFTAPASVLIGGVAATNVVRVSATQITAKSPAHAAATVDVQVSTGGGPSALSGADRFVYGAPTVTGLSIHSGPHAGGTTVTVTGTGFLAGDTVKFGGAAGTAVTVTSPTQLTVISPAGTPGATVDVTVTNPAGTSATSSADFYSYN